MNRLTIILSFMLATLSASVAMAQSDPVSVDVELSRERVYVGDELTYQIIVRGASNPDTPVVEFPGSVRAQYHGRTSQSFTSMRVINGRNSTYTDRRFSFQYTLTALESGEIAIPEPSVTINNQEYTGNAVSFESLFPVESESDQMDVTIDRDRIYLNETVAVQCAWWIGDQTSEFSLNSSSIPDSFEIRGLEPNISGQQRVQFEVNGQQMIGLVVNDQLDGRNRSKLVFRFSITPTQTGDFDLGPMRSIFTRHTGSGNSYRAFVESDPIEITVEPVPAQGQPDGYRGAIGSYQIRTSASNRTVNVGDPIRLTLKINGREPMVGVEEGPDLTSEPGFADRFKVSSEGWREILPRQSGQRAYETTIRATENTITEIPSIELPSFDPKTGSYQVYRSAPILITVNQVEEITLSDAIVTGGGPPSNQPPRGGQADVERVPLTRAMPGLWAHGSGDGMLDDQGFSLRRVIENPAWIAAAASGPGLFALSLVIALVRRRHDPRARELRRAWTQSRSLDRRGEHAKALRVYLAAALGINQDSVTGADAYKLPIQRQDARLAAERLIGDERSSFASDPASSESLPPARPDLLREIHARVMARKGALS